MTRSRRFTRWIIQHPAVGWLLSIAVFAASLLVRYGLDINLAFVTFYPAIVLSAFMAGRLAGSLVVLASAFAGWFIFLPPAYGFDFSGIAIASVAVFALVGLFLVAVIGSLRNIIVELAEERARTEAARREAEILMQELVHRAKNDHALIDAILHASLPADLRRTPAFQAASERLRALARSRDALLGAEAIGVDLHQLIARQLEPFCSGEVYAAQGPVLELSGVAARYLGLALHELCANAAKHGALSTPSGTISIDWDIRAGRFVFTWWERNPSAQDTGGRGFGWTLLKRLVPEALGGTVRYGKSDDGWIWEIQAPADTVLASPESLRKPTHPQNQDDHRRADQRQRDGRLLGYLSKE